MNFFLCNDDAFYKLVHIHNLDYDIFVCLVTLDKTVMTSLAVKKVKFKYSLIEICIYDYKCIQIHNTSYYIFILKKPNLRNVYCYIVCIINADIYHSGHVIT